MQVDGDDSDFAFCGLLHLARCLGQTSTSLAFEPRSQRSWSVKSNELFALSEVGFLTTAKTWMDAFNG